MEELMSKIEKCLKSSHSANFGGGGNSLRLSNESLENGTSKPCHPEERSDVRIALPSNLAKILPENPIIQPLSKISKNFSKKRLTLNFSLYRIENVQKTH